MEERRIINPLIMEIKTRLIDHIDRYERDWNDTQNWRLDMNRRLSVHCDFIKEVSPVYRRLVWILSIAVVVSIGLAVTGFWTHVFWK